LYKYAKLFRVFSVLLRVLSESPSSPPRLSLFRLRQPINIAAARALLIVDFLFPEVV
jgi:uncharacterized protein (DUF2336 family)